MDIQTNWAVAEGAEQLKDVLTNLSGKDPATKQYNILYKLNQQQSMIQVDFSHPSSTYVYHFDLQSRSATPPVKTAIEQTLQNAKFIDISGEKAINEMKAAMKAGERINLASVVLLEPKEAIQNIETYRADLIQRQKAMVGLQSHGLLGMFARSKVTHNQQKKETKDETATPQSKK